MRGLFVDTNTQRVVARRVSARWLSNRTPIAYIPGDFVVYPMGRTGRGYAVVNGMWIHGQALLIGVADDGSDCDANDSIVVAFFPHKR
jgi:hypothetical protein